MDRVKIKELHVKGISTREIRNKYFPNECMRRNYTKDN